MRNSVNRLVNCETANMNKTIDAASKQIDNIEFIQQRVGLGALPEKLQEIAELRLEHPEVSLKEVGRDDSFWSDLQIRHQPSNP